MASRAETKLLVTKKEHKTELHSLKAEGHSEGDVAGPRKVTSRTDAGQKAKAVGHESRSKYPDASRSMYNISGTVIGAGMVGLVEGSSNTVTNSSLSHSRRSEVGPTKQQPGLAGRRETGSVYNIRPQILGAGIIGVVRGGTNTIEDSTQSHPCREDDGQQKQQRDFKEGPTNSDANKQRPSETSKRWEKKRASAGNILAEGEIGSEIKPKCSLGVRTPSTGLDTDEPSSNEKGSSFEVFVETISSSKEPCPEIPPKCKSNAMEPRSSGTDRSEMVDTDKAAPLEESGLEIDQEHALDGNIVPPASLQKDVEEPSLIKNNPLRKDAKEQRLIGIGKSEMVLTQQVASPDDGKSKMVYRDEAPSLEKENAFLQPESLQMDKEEPSSDKGNENTQTTLPVAVVGVPESQEKAKRWMIKRAKYYMIVAAMIVSSAYVAIVRPPGEIDAKGFLLLRRDWISAFLVLNAMAFILSSTSILLFLLVLTSQYDIRDFSRLRRCLVLGFITLFTAMAGKLLSFSAEYSLMYQSKRKYFPAIIIVIVPAILGFRLMYVWVGKNSIAAPPDDSDGESSTSRPPSGDGSVVRGLATCVLNIEEGGREAISREEERGGRRMGWSMWSMWGWGGGGGGGRGWGRGGRERGECKWSAEFCFGAAIWIASGAHTAVLTPPGENNDQGIPRLLERKWFSIFSASNEVAFMFSVISAIIFFSIFIFQDDNGDSRWSMRCMDFGFVTLFIAVVGMAFNFTAVHFLTYQSKIAGLPITLFSLTFVAVVLSIVIFRGLWSFFHEPKAARVPIPVQTAEQPVHAMDAQQGDPHLGSSSSVQSPVVVQDTGEAQSECAENGDGTSSSPFAGFPPNQDLPKQEVLPQQHNRSPSTASHAGPAATQTKCSRRGIANGRWNAGKIALYKKWVSLTTAKV